MEHRIISLPTKNNKDLVDLSYFYSFHIFLGDKNKIGLANIDFKFIQTCTDSLYIFLILLS